MTRFKNFEQLPSVKEIECATDWTEKNVLVPFLNAAYIEPLNVLAGAAERLSGREPEPIVHKIAISPCQEFSPEYWTQSVASGLGSVIPYALAGRISGGGLRAIGSKFAIEGIAGKVLASESIAQIVGAGLYDSNKELHGKETHLQNGAAGMLSFSLIEAGNLLSQGRTKLVATAFRGTSGGCSGIISDVVAHPDNVNQKFFEMSNNYGGTFATGAAMSLLLPGAHAGVAKLHDKACLAFGKGIAIDRYLKLETDVSKSLVGEFSAAKIVEKHRWARIQPESESASYKHAGDLITLSPDKSGGKDLVHELQHRLEAKTAIAEPGFARAQDLLAQNDLRGAWTVFRSVRLAQELRANLAEHGFVQGTNKAPAIEYLKGTIPKELAKEGCTYERLWQGEFLDFVQKQGRSRPDTDYSSRRNLRELENAEAAFFKLMEPFEPKIAQYASTAKILRHDVRARNFTSIFNSLSKMVSEKESIPKNLFPERLALQTLFQIARPTFVRQGSHPTCALAALEYVNFSKHPENAVSLLSDVVRTGVYQTRDKTNISMTRLNILPEEYRERSHGNQLFQTTAANIYWQRQPKFEKLPDGQLMHAKPGPYGIVSYERRPLSDVYVTPYRIVEKASGKPIIYMSPEYSGPVHSPSINTYALNDIFEQINGTGRGDVSLPPYFSSQRELFKVLSENQRKSKLPMVMAVDTRHSPFAPQSGDAGAGGLHAVVATKFDPFTKMVSIFNPWGNFIPKMSLKDLWRSTQPID